MSMGFERAYTPERERKLEKMRNRMIRQETREARNRLRRDAHIDLRNDATSFLSHVTMRGPNECWPWTGPTEWNHQDPKVERYIQGRWNVSTGLEQAVRLMAFLAYDRVVPDQVDITPSCKDHLCMNPAHFLITGHGCDAETKHFYGEPASKWLCEHVQEVRK